jgi:HlyD family secretion protein
MSKKKIWMGLGVVVVLAVIGLMVARANAPVAGAQLDTAQLGRVVQATLSQTVDSSGSVLPEAEVTLGFGASGVVSKVNVAPGDHVKRGDVLAELDTSDLALQVAQQEQAYLIQQAAYSMTLTPDPKAVAVAEAQLASAEAAYQAAQKKYAANRTDQITVSCHNLDNVKQTYDDAVNAYNALATNWRVQVNGSLDLSPQKAQLDRAKANYDQAVLQCNLAKRGVNDSSVKSAEAQVEQARANLATLQNPSDRTVEKARIQLEQARLSLEQARRTLDDAKIVAPYDGVVTDVNAVAGAPGSGAAMVLLADTSQYHIDVLIDETEVGQVQPGQKVAVTFDALPEAKVAGTVSRIDPAGTISQGVVYYKTRIDLDPTTEPLLIDMTANPRIVIDTHTDVLAVPGGAVRSDPQGGYYVNVFEADGTARRVAVTTGFTDGDLTEVTGILQPGQQVFLSEPTTQATMQRGPLGVPLPAIR